MVAAVKQRSFNIHQRIAAADARIQHRFFNTGFNRPDKLSWDSAARDAVFEIQSRCCARRGSNSITTWPYWP